MRISSALAFVILTACSRPPAADSPALAEAEAGARAEENRVLCARGNADLARDCTVDRLQGDRGLTLTLRHPDGGFHRLLVTNDGRGVIAADGAEPARVAVLDDNMIEVALGNSRYRLPATIKGASARP